MPTRQLFVTAMTEAEILTGIATLPEGARRRGLADAVARTLDSLFAGRVLPLGSDAARAYAKFAAAYHTARRPVAQPECQIAAIARSRRMAVATRNVRDFMDAGIDVIDPWMIG